MAIKKENLPLPTSIIVTMVAYRILSLVFFKERPGVIRSEVVKQLLGILPHAIAVVNALAVMLSSMVTSKPANGGQVKTGQRSAAETELF